MVSWINHWPLSNPNDGPRAVPIVWPQYDETSRHHMILSSNMRAQPIDNQLLEHYTFWLDEFPDMVRELQKPGAGSWEGRPLMDWAGEVLDINAEAADKIWPMLSDIADFEA